MSRTWSDIFWRPAESVNDFAGPGTSYLVSIAALSVLTVGMTIWAQPLFDLTSRSAQQLLHPDEYVRAVLGSTP
jgi:multicomponent Na+:H+ antiporter subunit D